MTNFLLVSFGGAVGSVLRYSVGLWLKPASGATFPLSTFVVNVVGAFVIGMLAGWSGRQGWIGSAAWTLLATGLCGGFTTFSAFSLEGARMLEGGAAGMALLYLGGSVVVGVLLCAAGYRLAA